MSTLVAQQKMALRQQLSKSRALLSLNERQQAEKLIMAAIMSTKSWASATKIASYLSIKTEVNLSHLHQVAWQQQKKLYLPILAQDRLLFAPYTQNAKLELN
ncbi:MAG: 5-formyltetrahydrofolate cyclo-ligase, partial [Gammaproteobacteria bacterium]